MGDTIQLDQFRVPLCHELGGKSFNLIMDNSADTVLNFLDGENVQIAERGGAFRWESYRAMKADAAIYFVHIQPAKCDDLVNIVYVLDVPQRLVTMVTVQEGFDPEHPRLMQVIPYFGAIKVPGMPLPEFRHHLTKRMTGEHVYWTYKPDATAHHIYHTPTSVRLGQREGSSGKPTDFDAMLQKFYAEDLASDDPAVRETALKKIEQRKEMRRRYPFYEEPAFYIWINDHINLFSFIEENMCRRSENFNEGGGGMIVLQDIERLIDLGLCFNPQNYRYSDTYLLTAYGKRNENGDPIDNVPSPYNWDEITGMPSIRWEIPED